MVKRNVLKDAANDGVTYDSHDLSVVDPAQWAGIDPPDRRWALQDWLPEGHAAFFTGAGGMGKSLLGQLLATCKAVGAPFLGIPTEARPALYITCEDDLDELHRRQVAICHGLGISLADLSGKLLLSSRLGEVDNALTIFDRDGTFAKTPTWERIRHTVIEREVGLVVLDNVAHMFAGNENIRTDVTAFASMLGALAKEITGSVVLVGHPNKKEDTYSGSTAWENAFRARLYLGPHTDDDGSEDPGARKLFLPKSNYAKKGAAIVMRWHDGTFMLEEDVPQSTDREIRQISAATAENDAFLSCLRERAKQGVDRAVGPNSGANFAPAQFEGMPQAKGFKRDALKRAMNRLYQMGLIETVEVDRPGKSATKSIIVEVQGQFPNTHTADPNGSRTHSRTLPNAFPNGSRTAPERTPNGPEQARTHTPYTTYMSGGAFEAPAPDISDWGNPPDDELDWSSDGETDP